MSVIRSRGFVGFVLILGMLIPPGMALAQDAMPGQKKPRIIILQQRPDRIVATLPNRIILVAQNVPTAPVVSAQVWVKAGSIYDQKHLGYGMSHFLEHLLAGGATSTRSEADTNAILGRIGAQTNAATGLNNVHYYINTTSDHTATAVALLSDWMQNSLITQREYQRERSVIPHEFEMDAGEPDRLLWRLTKRERYIASPARFPVIGFLHDFLSVSRDEIYDYYKAMYVPNNMVFVVAGKIDPKQVIGQLANLWAGVKTKELPREMFPTEPEIEHPRSIQGYADVDEPRISLAFPGTTLQGPHDYAMDLLAVILGQGDASRLVQTVRNKQGLASTISAYNWSVAWGRGLFNIEAHVHIPAKPGDSKLSDKQWQAKQIDKTKEAILKQIALVRTKGVTEKELNRAKHIVVARIVRGNQTVQGVASNLAENIITTGNPDYLAHYADAIKNVTIQQVDAAAKKYFVPHKLITVTVLPQLPGYKPQPPTRPKPNPAAKNVPEHAFKLDNQRLIKEIKANVQSNAPKNEVAEVGKPVLYTLPNGLRLIVQRSTVVPAVAIQMYSLGGLLGDGAGHEGTANAVYAMLPKGTDKYSADELSSIVESMGATLTTGGGNNTNYIQATALKQNWRKMLGIFADVVLHPTFPADQWQQVQPRLLAAIAGQSDTWYGQLSEDFHKVYFDNHPWSWTPLGSAKVVAELSPKDLRTYYRDHLDAKRSVLAVVGDVQPKEVKAEVKKWFGKLPSEAKVPFQPALPEQPQATRVQKLTKKPLAAVEIGFGPGLVRSSPDYPAMRVLGSVLGAFPSGWLPETLRGKGKGLVYAVWAQTVTGLVPGYFAVVFNTSPNQLRQALEGAMQVCRRVKTKTVSHDDLTRAQALVLTQVFFARQSDADRATNEALNEIYGLPDLTGKHFLREVKSVTSARLNQVARKYLTNPVIVVLTHKKIDLPQTQASH